MNKVDINVHTVQRIETKVIKHGEFEVFRVEAYDQNNEIVSETTYFSYYGKPITVKEKE